jgi:putative membrane protein
MKSVLYITFIGIALTQLTGCSSRRSSSDTATGPRKSKISGLSPTTGRPSTAVINASGDALTPGVNSHNRTTGSSKENAVAIANGAINRANEKGATMMLRLDTLTGTQFIERFSASNQRQMTITKVAQKDGESQKIKDYASMILKEHLQLQADWSKISASDGVRGESLIVTKLQPIHHSAKLRDTSEYIQTTIEDHQSMIRLLEAASRSGNASLAAFAAKYLPLLKKHLAAAQELTIKQ